MILVIFFSIFSLFISNLWGLQPPLDGFIPLQRPNNRTEVLIPIKTESDDFLTSIIQFNAIIQLSLLGTIPSLNFNKLSYEKIKNYLNEEEKKSFIIKWNSLTYEERKKFIMQLGFFKKQYKHLNIPGIHERIIKFHLVLEQYNKRRNKEIFIFKNPSFKIDNKNKYKTSKTPKNQFISKSIVNAQKEIDEKLKQGYGK